GRRHGVGPGTLVVVAAHRGDRRDPAELAQDVGVADVAGVYDGIAAAQEVERFGAQQAVGVGNEADAKHARVLRAVYRSRPCSAYAERAAHGGAEARGFLRVADVRADLADDAVEVVHVLERIFADHARDRPQERGGRLLDDALVHVRERAVHFACSRGRRSQRDVALLLEAAEQPAHGRIARRAVPE